MVPKLHVTNASQGAQLPGLVSSCHSLSALTAPH